MTVHTRRYKQTRLVSDLRLQGKTGPSVELNASGTGLIVDYDYDDATEVADDIDDEMAEMGFDFVSEDPATTPDQESNAVHTDVAAEINGVTEKATPVDGDWVLIEDSAASNAKKKAQLGNLPGGGGGGFPTYEIPACELRSSLNADLAVNANAPLVADTNNAGLQVRRHDSATEEGSWFERLVPTGAVSMKIRLFSRAEVAHGSVEVVKTGLYSREIPDNAAVASWSSKKVGPDVSLPTNENPQDDEKDDTLANWGVTAGKLFQFQITRDATNASDTYNGDDWSLYHVTISFS